MRKYKRREWTIQRRQKPIRGGREHLTAGVERQILRAVESEAMRYHVSKAFVMSVRLAKSYGIDIEDDL